MIRSNLQKVSKYTPKSFIGSAPWVDLLNIFW
jgi:hypothetical protein